MPLKKGTTQKAVAYNIRELVQTGRPKRQAVAIAFTVAKKPKKPKRRKKIK